jgi:hypothetical protein
MTEERCTLVPHPARFLPRHHRLFAVRTLRMLFHRAHMADDRRLSARVEGVAPRSAHVPLDQVGAAFTQRITMWLAPPRACGALRSTRRVKLWWSVGGGDVV